MKKILFLVIVMSLLMSCSGILALTTNGTSLSISGNAISGISYLESFSPPNSAHLEADKITGDTNEGRVRINFASGTILGDINTISWMQKVIEGYASHVDVLIDTNGDGTSDDALVFEYAKVKSDDCDDTTDYPENIDGWINTFLDKGIVDANAYAWLSSGPAGPCGNVTFGLTYKTLAEWKSIHSAYGVIAIEIEVDGWIPTNAKSEAYIDDIKINGDLAESFETGLKGTLQDYIQLNVLPKSLDFGSIPYGVSITKTGSDVTLDTAGSNTNSSKVFIDLSIEGTNKDFFNSLLEFKSGSVFEKVVSIPVQEFVAGSFKTYNTRLHGNTLSFNAGAKNAALVYTATAEPPLLSP